MTKIKAVGIDLDDTLIISEKEKIDVMEEIFCEKYNIVKIGEEYKELIGKGLSRDDKLKILFYKHMKRFPTDDELKELSMLFSKKYKSKLDKCPLFQCYNIISELKKQVDCLFLISLENEDDIKELTDHCGLSKFFDEILGGPTSKIENLMDVMEKYKLEPDEMMYIGDTQGDYAATKELGIEFIGVNKDFEYQKLLRELGAHFVFSNLCEVPTKEIIK